jgi:TonB family protein
MKAMSLIGGATLLLLAGVSVGSFSIGRPGCSEGTKAAIPFFDPFVHTSGSFTQEPWLDPLVFFSKKAYVVEALPGGTTAGRTDAVFIGGRDSLVSYLKGAIQPHIVPGMGWLKPPVVEFTVGPQGEAANAVVVATSGHAGLDAQLVQAITAMPRWTPAMDAKGGAVEQRFVFRVLQGGCDAPPPVAPTKDAGTGHLPVTDPKAVQEHPYDLRFTVKKAGDKTYTLVTSMELHGGSYYASPNCTRDMKGKFHLELAEQDQVILAKRFKEIPLGLQSMLHHPVVHGPMDWITQDTRYEHTLTVNTAEDLDVTGFYRFTIEPRCTLEEIPFVIKQRSGVLTIEGVGC